MKLALDYQTITFSVGVWWSGSIEILCVWVVKLDHYNFLLATLRIWLRALYSIFPLLFLLLRLTGTSYGIIIIFRMLFLMWVVVAMTLLLEPGLAESCVMTHVYSLRVSLVSFEDHLTSCWLSFMLSIMVWSWRRIWVIQNLFDTLIILFALILWMTPLRGITSMLFSSKT